MPHRVLMTIHTIFTYNPHNSSFKYNSYAINIVVSHRYLESCGSSDSCFFHNLKIVARNVSNTFMMIRRWYFNRHYNIWGSIIDMRDKYLCCHLGFFKYTSSCQPEVYRQYQRTFLSNEMFDAVESSKEVICLLPAVSLITSLHR